MYPNFEKNKPSNPWKLCLVNLNYKFPANIYLLKVSTGNTGTIREICSKLTIMPPQQPQWWHSGVSFVNFEQISFIGLLFSLLTLKRQMPESSVIVKANCYRHIVKCDIRRCKFYYNDHYCYYCYSQNLINSDVFVSSEFLANGKAADNRYARNRKLISVDFSWMEYLYKKYCECTRRWKSFVERWSNLNNSRSAKDHIKMQRKNLAIADCCLTY